MVDVKRVVFLSSICINALLASCSSLVITSLPTPYPTEYIPTVIAMTLAAQGIILEPAEQTVVPASATPSPRPTLKPTKTSLPSPTRVPPTLVPQATSSPVPTYVKPVPTGDIPLSIIQILSPGPGSKVISPFILRAAVKPGDDSVVRIELIGEGGQLLMRDVRAYQNPDEDWLSLGEEITFGLNAVAETGRLQISIEDQHGRLKSVSSCDLTLQSLGNQDLLHPQDQLEEIVLESPRPNRLIQGGTMRVTGKARPHSTQPFRIEITTSDGKIVGTRQVSVIPAAGSQYGTFAIDVPYHVTSTSRVRVQVWEPGSDIPGIINLSSVEVLLSP